MSLRPAHPVSRRLRRRVGFPALLILVVHVAVLLLAVPSRILAGQPGSEEAACCCGPGCTMPCAPGDVPSPPACPPACIASTPAATPCAVVTFAAPDGGTPMATLADRSPHEPRRLARPPLAPPESPPPGLVLSRIEVRRI